MRVVEVVGKLEQQPERITWGGDIIKVPRPPSRPDEKIIDKQPAAESELPQYRHGAVLHQQQGIETAAFMRAGQFDYQRSARQGSNSDRRLLAEEYRGN